MSQGGGLSYVVVIDYAYQPRTEFHIGIHRKMDSHRFGAVVTHRRFGKTVLSLNHLILSCLENKRRKPEPRYGFIQPFLGQVKLTAWQYLLDATDNIPGIEIMVSELKVTLPNHGYVRLFGADNPQAFRGGYFDGVILDEYAKMSPILFPQIIRPQLSDFSGFCYFLDTPNGRNDFYARCEQAKTDAKWFYARHKASETGIISAEELADARKDMTQDEYAQEYECSFEAAVKGAIYASALESARSGGRVCAVPYDPIIPMDTDWDLGVGDSTAIWFSQSLRSGEVRVVDYYEASGEGLPHYAQVLKDKGYTYGTHWAPHDIAVRELGSGRSRLETASTLGIRFNICPNIPLEDGIHAARMLFPRCYFDAGRCKAGLEALQHYRRDYNTRLNEFKATPVHDWAEHGSSAFRYLAVRQQAPREKHAQQAYRPPRGTSMDWAG